MDLDCLLPVNKYGALWRKLTICLFAIIICKTRNLYEFWLWLITSTLTAASLQVNIFWKKRQAFLPILNKYIILNSYKRKTWNWIGTIRLFIVSNIALIKDSTPICWVLKQNQIQECFPLFTHGQKRWLCLHIFQSWAKFRYSISIRPICHINLLFKSMYHSGGSLVVRMLDVS